MKSPWKWSASLEAERDYLVLASRIPPLSRRATWRMFRGASKVRRQLDTTDGVIGFSLLARPLRKQYATLSVWRDEATLAAFAGSEPHQQLMNELAPQMGPTNFIRWSIRGSEGRPSWNDALQRLA